MIKNEENLFSLAFDCWQLEEFEGKWSSNLVKILST
jgi:hypothetical protein